MDGKYERQRLYKASEHGRAVAAKRRKERMATDPDYRERRREANRRYRRNHPETVKEENARNAEKNRGAIRNSNLKALYGITADQYTRMYEQQGGRCAICGGSDPGGKKRFLCVDHDHRTGAVRQLLCDPCNNGLGRFKDDLEVLQRACEYLRRHTG